MIGLRIGDTFATPAESGCVVTGEPDAEGGFLALDSDGVECRFSLAMIVAPGGGHIEGVTCDGGCPTCDPRRFGFAE